MLQDVAAYLTAWLCMHTAYRVDDSEAVQSKTSTYLLGWELLVGSLTCPAWA